MGYKFNCLLELFYLNEILIYLFILNVRNYINNKTENIISKKTFIKTIIIRLKNKYKRINKFITTM